MQAELVATLADHRLLEAEKLRETPVGKPLALESAQPLEIQRFEPARLNSALLLDQVLDLPQEPGIDACQAIHFLQRPARAKGICNEQHAIRPRRCQLLRQGAS